MKTIGQLLNQMNTIVSPLITGLVFQHRLKYHEPLRQKIQHKQTFKIYVPALNQLFVSSYGNLWNVPIKSLGIIQPDGDNSTRIKLCDLFKAQRWVKNLQTGHRTWRTFFFAQEIESSFDSLPVSSWTDVPVSKILCRLTLCSNK